jgi:dihydrofolate reductase
MSKVIYAMSVSLDGCVESASGDLSWSYPDAELHEHFNEQERAIGTYLYGRRLYENMAGFWPGADEDPAAPKAEIEYARIWKEKPKIVFSKTLHEVGWNAQLFKGNIAEEIRKLKAQPGNDMSVGGATLAGAFMQLGLIDEYRLYLHPVILGGGKRMFPQLTSSFNLTLVETHRFGSGVVLLRLAARGGSI